jgi:fibronectin-binding autotransporter adhesin
MLTDAAALTLSGNSRANVGVRVTAPTITSTGLLADNGPIQFHLTNANAAAAAFAQTGGTIAAGTTLVVSGASDSTPLVGGITQQAGTMAATSNLLLFAQGDATQLPAGTIASANVQVVSTGAANNFAASQAAAIVMQPATVDLNGLLPSFAVTDPAATVTFTGRPATVRLDGASVTIARTIAADAVDLHATNAVAEAGGNIVAQALTGTAGYAASTTDAATGLPIYGALDGAKPGAGAMTLNAANNNIQTIGTIQARSGLSLTDAVADQTASSGRIAGADGLIINGTVRAGVATDPLTGAAADQTGAPLALTLLGTKSTLAFNSASVLAGGVVSLTTPGAITEASNALLVASTLTGAASTVSLAPGAGNQVVRLGAFTSGADFTLANTVGLLVTGAVQAGAANPASTTPTISLSAPTLDLVGGSLRAGTLALTTTGATTETNGVITANTLTLNTARFSAPSAQNQIAILSNATAPGGLLLTDGRSLTITGPVAASAGPIGLQVAGDLAIQSAVTSSGAVTLNANGLFTEAASGVITAASLTSVSGGAVSLAGVVSTSGAASFAAPLITQTGSVASTGGAVSYAATAGDLALTAGSKTSAATDLSMTVSGADTLKGAAGATPGAVVTAGGAMTVNAGSISFEAGSAVAAQGGLTLNAANTEALAGSVGATGPIAITATTLNQAATSTLSSADTLTGNVGTLNFAAGSLTQTQNGIGITAIGGASLSGIIVSPGSISLAASTINASSSSQIASTGAAVTLGAASGDLTLAAGSTTTAVGGLTLNAAGAETLQGVISAAGPVSLTAATIYESGALFSTGGAITASATGGDLTLAPSSSLNAATGISLKAAGAATLAGAVNSPGPIGLAAASVFETSSGTLASSGGAVAMTATTGDLTLAEGSNTGALTTMTLTAGNTATLAGAESAHLLVVDAPAITLQGGSISVDPVFSAQPAVKSLTKEQLTAPPATYGSGMFFQAGTTFIQNGATTFGARGGGNAEITARIDLLNTPSTLSFSNLRASGTDLILNLGSGGSGNGNEVLVKNLAIVFTGSGNLNLNTVTIGTQTGQAAAGAGAVVPEPKPTIKINSCAVSSVNCVIIHPQLVPITNPVKDFNLNISRDQADADALIVPDTSDQGL